MDWTRRAVEDVSVFYASGSLRHALEHHPKPCLLPVEDRRLLGAATRKSRPQQLGSGVVRRARSPIFMTMPRAQGVDRIGPDLVAQFVVDNDETTYLARREFR